jgi:hypothetical protein
VSEYLWPARQVQFGLRHSIGKIELMGVIPTVKIRLLQHTLRASELNPGHHGSEGGRKFRS